MFYSQFILAKKGPLGTIWIAAHLERKLRKNQVADTDIGVSVDSILFPDVPIALRLSSHLLLGVVRIYNRKVNYLFDDCSEALLKVKQAFRSTAVDLPPEQSKAPYHSITLPETFDLDDFELPDNDIFQGNYVDHHVSSREQITLQDTMDGVAYSTTRFGLDERFGDGDTSGLDLDEELFLDKVGASGHAGLSSSTDPQASIQTMVALKQGDQHEGMAADSVPMIDVDDEVIHLMDDAQAPRTPGLVEEPNLSNAQETSACDDHFESEHRHLTESAVKENLENISGETDIHHLNKHVDGWSLPDDKNSHSVVHKLSENGYHSGDLDIKQLKPQEISSATEVTIEHFSPDNHASASGPSSLLDKQVKQVSPVLELADKIVEASDFPHLKEHINEGVVDNDKANMCSAHEALEEYERPDGSNWGKSAHDISGSAGTCQQALESVPEYNHTSPVIEVSDNLESAGILGKSHSPSNALDLDIHYQGIPCHEKAEGQTLQEEIKSKILSLDINGEITGAQRHALRPCNANLDQPDSSNPEGDQSVDPNLFNENATPGSVEVFRQEETRHASETSAVAQGEACHVIDGSKKITREDNAREGALDEGIHSAIDKSNDEVDNGISGGSPVENVNSSAGPDLPAPEKLLSVTEGPDDLPGNLLMESTPRDLVRNDDGDAGSNVISGKKRSYTESTLTEQSLNSIESSRIVRGKRTVECIPDDDDLLSSILVGRRSSVLKVKPSPATWAITSVKRTHSAPRTSAVKRKVLMDDTMVLHGDTIRQQLMNTEDIRRVRKKAPCTRPEISMIQKQFLEDEIFIEPVYTGVSIELASLHNQPCDLSGIRISIDDVNCASPGTATDIRLINQNDNNRNLNTENAVDSNKESEWEGTNKLLVVTEHCEGETAEAPSVDMNKLDEDNSVSLDVNSTQSQMRTTTDVEPNSVLLEPPEDVAEREIDVRSSSITDGVNVALPGVDESSLHTDQVSGDRGDTSADVAQVAPFDDNSTGVIQTADDNKTCEADASLLIDVPDISYDQKIDEVSLRMDATGGEVVEGHDIVGKDCDHTAAVEAEPRTGDEVLMGAAEGDATVETAADANNRETEYYSRSLVDEGTEQSIMDSFPGEANEQSIMDSFPGEANMHVEDVVLGDGEHPSQEVFNPLNTIDAEISAFYDDFNYSTAGNDTEFLNVDDDDEVVEPTDDYVPNEEARFTENSGWSSRTRAVSNYLQTMFAKQLGHARPTLSMDNLLVGKTRKEASRMFFEALVLKTKDYIHVEQGNSFDNITIKPRTKLMKSDF